MAKRSSKREEQKYGSAGYPVVERLIDTEDFNSINGAFERGYGELYELSRRKRSFKTQKDVKRAMRALELTLELFRELLAIKYRLQEESAKRSKKK